MIEIRTKTDAIPTINRLPRWNMLSCEHQNVCGREEKRTVCNSLPTGRGLANGIFVIDVLNDAECL
jgi:hypothetical protein